MIQRVQTYYLALVIIIQGIAVSGTNFFTFKTGTEEVVFNAWGTTKYAGGKIVDQTTIPVFIGFIALALLAFLCIMSYKNIERQFRLGRTVFYLYFVSVLSLYLMSLFGDGMIGVKDASREMGLGYWAFIAGFPFSFMANTGIKRDKKLLDSLKRL